MKVLVGILFMVACVGIGVGGAMLVDKALEPPTGRTLYVVFTNGASKDYMEQSGVLSVRWEHGSLDTCIVAEHVDGAEGAICGVHAYWLQ